MKTSATAATSAGRPFDAVLCDVDNVIRCYDTTELANLERRAGVAEGTTAKVGFAPERGRPLLLGEITKAEWARSIAAGLAGLVPQDLARELGAALTTAPARADAAVVDMLTRARAHVPVVLVTNASVELEEELAALGLDGLADHVVSSARTGVAKPDARIYAIAADLASVPPHRCLFVDDSPENVEAAAGLGMKTVHYRSPHHLRTALTPLLDN
ncbi:HAD family hydrolase [Streptomyces sp. NPDC050560]|uniref:HAD family hydrolase n=1 Tax=Streptomyces sp. NPDC050560 TaxID=3365630 RepID=UPI003790E32C